MLLRLVKNKWLYINKVHGKCTAYIKHANTVYWLFLFHYPTFVPTLEISGLHANTLKLVNSSGCYLRQSWDLIKGKESHHYWPFLKLWCDPSSFGLTNHVYSSFIIEHYFSKVNNKTYFHQICVNGGELHHVREYKFFHKR